MSYSYDTRKKPAGKAGMTDAAAPAEAVQTNMTPTAADKGSRVDLPDAMRAKMENAFGADLSAVKLYESQAVADAGAEAVTRGSEIAFAPGKFDLASTGGQALLGHELSHVVSQQRGEVTGSGFLNDHALEARADREGAMAAAGQQVYAGPVTGAMSAAAPAVATAGPMQAARKSAKEKQAEENDWFNDRQAVLKRGETQFGKDGSLTGKEWKRYDSILAKRWKAQYKGMDKKDFYDMIEEQMSDNDTKNATYIPKYARQFYYKNEGNRWSGKKGWGTPEELEQRNAARKKKERELYGDAYDEVYI